MTNKFKMLLKFPISVARCFIVIINNIYCIPTYLIWMGLLSPLKMVQPCMFHKIEGIFFHWLLSVVAMWSYTAGYDIVEVGDDIDDCLNKRTLVIANHQSTGDVPLLMANFATKDRVLPNIMWIMDRLFKYTNFGVVSLIHEDFFISSGRDKREKALVELKKHIKKSYMKNDRKWIVLFPEGGFLHKRRSVSQRYIEKNNLPPLEYVTLPRVGAMQAIFETMVTSISEMSSLEEQIVSCNKMENGELTPSSIITTNTTFHQADNETIPKENVVILNSAMESEAASLKDQHEDATNNRNLLDYVLDITVAYPERKPVDLTNIIHGWRNPCKTYMLYRLYKVSEIPTDANELTQWLYDRFYEKNSMLENFYKNGHFFTNRTVNLNVIQQDNLRLLLINLFFITSTYFHCQILSVCYRYCAAYIAQNVS